MHAALVVTLLAAIDVSTANRAFSELDQMCAADAGRMWGRSLCGPIVFADPRTRDAISREGVTTIPKSIGIANTSVQWNGKNWTMVMWPLPEKTIARRVLLAHESFHRVQRDLGLPLDSPPNAYLDSAASRAWMRLEWRALARALAKRDRNAVAAALAFRAQRHTSEERLLEMNEGLAEDTGYALAVPNIDERIPSLTRMLATAEKGQSFARSFAYASGSAWGTLIEMKERSWTRKIQAGNDLGAIAERVWKVRAKMPPDNLYDEGRPWDEEKALRTKKAEVQAALRAKFVEGPLLTMPLSQMQFTFDPNEVQPFGELGTVYPSMEVRDVWGTIRVRSGGLISSDYSRLVVPANGEGYDLELNEGWKIVPGPRDGDRTVSRQGRDALEKAR